jgi:hypothetical protein
MIICDGRQRPLSDDTVEKVFWGWRTKFSRAADAFRAQRCEGPLRFSEKRPRTFPLALCSIPTADLSKNQHLRDFWSFSIFDFFNSIGRDGTDSATDLPWHELRPIGATGKSVETGKPPSMGRKLNLPGLQSELDQTGSIQIRNQQSNARKRGIWQLGNFGTGADGAICSGLIGGRGMPHGAGQ